MDTFSPVQEKLISVVYVSSARLAQQDRVVDILRISRENNSRADITGLLAYKDGNFLQVLEGPATVVTGVVQSIERDPRHRGMIVLARREARERMFPNWSMAYRDLNLEPDDASVYSGFLDGELLEERLRHSPDLCFKLLLSFKKSMRFD